MNHATVSRLSARYLGRTEPYQVEAWQRVLAQEACATSFALYHMFLPRTLNGDIWAFPNFTFVRPGAQLKEAKRRRHKEADKEKRKQREELALIREAEAQKAHEAALAAIEGEPASALIPALQPPAAPSLVSDPMPPLGFRCPSVFWS